ncbi:MAG: hypothetical protein NVS9B4_14520 [Candidatus Acidiferrum sp.]
MNVKRCNRGLHTQDNPKARWQQLCERAAAEPDTEKLIELVQEINQLLDDDESHKSRNRPAKEDQVSN